MSKEHNWFLLFVETPALKAPTVCMEVAKEKLVTNSVDDSSSSKGKVHNQTSRTLPSFSVSGKIGEVFKKRLTGSCVGY